MTKIPCVNNEQFSHGLGWRPDIPDRRDYRYSVKLVDHMDAAIAITKPHVCTPSFRRLPITDQRNTSACTGHSTSRMWGQERKLTPRSPLFAYWYGRKAIGETQIDEGAYIRDVIKGIGVEGNPRDDLWEDVDDNLFREPAARAEIDAEKRLPLEYHRVGATGDETRVRQDILACLASGHSFVTGVSCYDSLFSERTLRTGLVLLPEGNEALQGGHALHFGEYWINNSFKDSEYAQTMRNRGIPDSLIPEEVACTANSWGKQYGIDGYFFFDLAYLTNRDLADDTWTLRAK